MYNQKTQKMPKNDLLLAYLYGNEVAIAGGFKHQTKGHMAEIVGTEEKVPRQSISIWELCYADVETAKNVFMFCFGYMPERALNIDKEKGVLKTRPNLIKQKEMALA